MRGGTPSCPGAPIPAKFPKISPVEASRRLLLHVRRSWDDAFPAQPLSEQSVVLTVPASFDEVARELTVEAAELAGLHVRLLEEPQAAFYDLVASGRDAIEALLTPERSSAAVVLGVYVGGGTTDLTLIEARRGADGELKLERVAVGRHLLLGGDNIDCSRQLREQRLLEGERLDSAALQPAAARVSLRQRDAARSRRARDRRLFVSPVSGRRWLADAFDRAAARGGRIAGLLRLFCRW